MSELPCLRLLPLLLCLLGWAAPAVALTRAEQILFFGQDDRIKVNPRQEPWSMVIKWQTRAHTTCTGALVAPDIIVSAGHCLLTEQGRFDPGTWAYAGYRNGRYAHRRPIAAAWVPPGFIKGLSYRKDGLYIDAAVAHLDISFLRLQRPFPAAVGQFLLAPAERVPYLRLINALGWRATQSGYARDQEETQLAHPNCRLTRFNGNKTLQHRCDTLEGDSGAPIFALVNGRPTLLAIQSSAPPPHERYLADNISVSVPAWAALFQDWRRGLPAAGEPKPDPSRRTAAQGPPKKGP